jgi:hypothetical protein
MNTLMKKLVASATVLMCGTMMLAPGMGSAMTEDELQGRHNTSYYWRNNRGLRDNKF